MPASGNAGWMEGAIPISEIIHHSVRRTSSRAFTSRREPSSKRDGIFFPMFFFFLSLSFLPSTINRSQSSLASTFLDVASRCDSHDAPPPFKKSTCEYASWITRFCSSLKTTPHNGSHERTYAQHLSSFHHRTLHSRVTLRFSPAGPKTSPFQSHSTLLRFSSRLRSR